MIKKIDRNKSRKNRHLKARKKGIFGTAERPRLTIKKSNKNIFAQIIDDSKGNTIVQASTLDKNFELRGKSNMEAAKTIGAEIAKRAVAKGIEAVVFDRSGYLYHGRIQTLADSARENGLKF